MDSQAYIPATDQWIIDSNATRRPYRISVALPFSYHHEPEQVYPAVYLLDANLYFGLVTDMVRLLQMNGSFPSVIVVGIGYPLGELYGENFRQFVLWRDQDFTPVADKSFEQETAKWLGIDAVKSGDASRFLDFLALELLPKIENKYRADSMSRALVGHSLGGTCALYALFHQPDLFKRYVVGSPALAYGDRVLFRLEEEYAVQHEALAASLFLGIGGDEETLDNPLDALVSVSDFYRFSTILQYRRYAEFKLTRAVFPGHDHLSVVAPLFQTGLKRIFS